MGVQSSAKTQGLEGSIGSYISSLTSTFNFNFLSHLLWVLMLNKDISTLSISHLLSTVDVLFL